MIVELTTSLNHQILPTECARIHHFVLFRFGTIRPIHRRAGRLRFPACSQNKIRRMGKCHPGPEEPYSYGHGGRYDGSRKNRSFRSRVWWRGRRNHRCCESRQSYRSRRQTERKGENNHKCKGQGRTSVWSRRRMGFGGLWGR